MKILLIHQDWFAAEWRAAGHDVMVCSLNGGHEVTIESPFLHIDTVIKSLPGGFQPDRIVIFDNSSPMILSGYDECHIPVLFYSVDTHHHAELHRFLYEVFDMTLIAQRDYLPYFREWGQEPEWMPLWASRYVEPSFDVKNHGAVFVGNLNPNLNPQRTVFFDSLKQHTDILCTMGEYWKIFPFSEIVVNQTVKGDLNFRVFEAMMCGAMLLTEKSENGLFDLFEDGKHFVTYTKNDASQAAELIRHYTAHPEQARQIARAGREEIVARHLPQHRADWLLEKLLALQKVEKPRKHFALAANFMILAGRLRQKKFDESMQQQALIQALRSAELGFSCGEALDGDYAIHVLGACFFLDILTNDSQGKALLLTLAEAYPEEKTLQCGKIRCLLNEGRIEEARALSERCFEMEPEMVFSRIESLITALIG